jgi:hypothetical protein|tara:strand:- start:84 stop:422 length:339 start_codon:yes stop_codon:yes gene_type:complete
MVSKDHDLSVWRQCSLLLLTRSNLYYQPKGESAENLRFMVIIDKQFLETPWLKQMSSLVYAGLWFNILRDVSEPSCLPDLLCQTMLLIKCWTYPEVNQLSKISFRAIKHLKD